MNVVVAVTKDSGDVLPQGERDPLEPHAEAIGQWGARQTDKDNRI